MKYTLTVFALMVGLNAQAKTTVDDLKFNCSGKVHVKTSQPFFVPTHCPNRFPQDPTRTHLPNCGRALPIPASAGFKIQAKITELEDSCSILKTKYELDMEDKVFETTFFLNEPNYSSAQALSKKMNETSVDFNFGQNFAFQINGELPLYPEHIKESLQLVGKNESGSFHFSLPVDSQKVYGIPNLDQMNDQEKLEVLYKQLEYAHTQVHTGKMKTLTLPFQGLLKALIPKGELAKLEYADLILNIFESVATQKYPPALYFEFNVGGSPGTALAFGLIDSKALKGEKLSKVLSEYPGLLLTFRAEKLPLTQDILVNAFSSFLQLKQPMGSVYFELNKKKIFKKVANTVLSPHYLSVFIQKPDLVTPELKELAQKIVNL